MEHPLLRWFESDHLKPELQSVVKPFQALAQDITIMTNPGAEQTVALRKLLESKDAAVRQAVLDMEEN